MRLYLSVTNTKDGRIYIDTEQVTSDFINKKEKEIFYIDGDEVEVIEKDVNIRTSDNSVRIVYRICEV